MKRVFFVVVMILLPSLAMAFSTPTSPCTGDVTFADGTEYLIVGQYVCNGSTGTVTVEGGSIIKFSDTSPGQWNVGKITTSGTTAANPAYWTSCNDDTIGTDFGTASGDCGDTTPDGDDWLGMTAGGTVSLFTLDYLYWKYGRSMAVFSNVFNPTPSGSVSNSIFDDPSDSAGDILISVSSLSFGAEITFENNIMRMYAGEAFRIRPIDSATTNGTVNIKNNLMLMSTSNSYFGIRFLQDNNFTIDANVYNNTIVCLDPSTNITGIDVDDTHAGVIVKDNIVAKGAVSNCPKAYEANVGDNHDHDYNMAYGATTAWSGSWVEATNEVDDVDESANPDFTEHTDDNIPTWADDYHLGPSQSDAVDGGSRSASAAGLDDRHALSTGSNDSGTVDLGFHYPSADGGGEPEEEGEAAPAILPPVMNPLNGKGIKPWEI